MHQPPFLLETPLLQSPVSNKQGVFLRFLFDENEGYICIARRQAGKGPFEEEFFRWPSDVERLLDYVTRYQAAFDLWYCPMLFDTTRRSKEHVCFTPAAWADLDGCPPDRLLVEPTVILETSPNRFQALWKFTETVEPYDAEAISRRIAYYHAEDGCDKSGWDLTQLLRIPYSYNQKYRSTIDLPQIRIIQTRSGTIDVAEFDVYPEAAGYEYGEIPFPDELPASAEEVLKKYRTELHPKIWQLFQEVPEEDWSRSLWSLQMLLFETELSREEVFVVARAAACNKYARDKKGDAPLWKEVCRAHGQVRQRRQIVEPVSPTKELPDLLTDQERALVESETTFVEEYTAWARTLGDAAWQYHQAGAFVVLSCLLAGSVRLPTSFGTVVPNLWFMILADTTLTRKSTAMDLAMDLLLEIDNDCVLATDGSIEGLMTSLSMRPGRASIFLRDEFSGLLDAMTRKDYYAGMAETFTKLYDGKFQKRILRKDIIEVKDPILIFFAGGIKGKTLSLVTHEQVASGFIPRFVFVMAESDVSKLKPLGPPTDRSMGERDRILTYMHRLYSHYAQGKVLTVNGSVKSTMKRFDARLTPEAWARYNKFEADLLDLGLKSDHPDLTTPTMDRLAKSGLKASVLLSASRQLVDSVVVEEQDIVRAFYYVEQWRPNSIELLENIGKSALEKDIDLVYGAIQRQPNVMRSKLMRDYHLTKRDADLIIDTLDQRGLISRVRSGKSERYSAV